MINKIQKIKEEIEKRLSLLWDLIPEGEKILKDNFTKEDANNLGKYTELESLLKLIDSLPEEPSEDLEEAAEECVDEEDYSIIDNDGYPLYTSEYLEYMFKKGAEWQKQKDYKMYAHVPLKDIHDAWQELKTNKPDIENYPSVCFQKGADWRENQMKETLQTEYEKGRFDMRMEMMKTLIGGEVVKDLHNQLSVKSEPLNNAFGDIKFGDKVKIIIVKEN